MGEEKKAAVSRMLAIRSQRGSSDVGRTQEKLEQAEAEVKAETRARGLRGRRPETGTKQQRQRREQRQQQQKGYESHK